MEGARAHFSNGSWYSQVYVKVAISKLLKMNMWRYSSNIKDMLKVPNAHQGNPLSKRPRHQEEACTREIHGPLCFLQNNTKLKQKQQKKWNRGEGIGWWYVNMVLWIQDHMKDFYQINILIGLHLVLKQRLCKTKKKTSFYRTWVASTRKSSLLSTRTRINVSRSLRNSLPFDAWWSVRFFTAPCRSERSMTAV